MVRFDSDNQDVRKLRDLRVGRGRFGTDFFGEGGGSGGNRIAGDDLFGRDEFGSEQINEKLAAVRDEIEALDVEIANLEEQIAGGG